MRLSAREIPSIVVVFVISISIFMSACSQPVDENVGNGGQLSGKDVTYSRLDDELARQYMYELIT